MRLENLLSRLRGHETDNPRDRFADLLRDEFGTLDPALIDAFFANFGYTMPLPLVQQLVQLVRMRKPALVVEVGSGVSTLALSSALAAHSGYLVSIEQDPSYAAATARDLARPDRVALVCASGGPELVELARGWRPDLVVIDGPTSDRFAEHWLQLYRSLLSAECVCAIDDTHRADNDAGAACLAAENGLDKRDFDDPMFAERRYSLLLPAGIDPVLHTDP